jgi:hypothetical protein
LVFAAPQLPFSFGEFSAEEFSIKKAGVINPGILLISKQKKTILLF